jgi:4-azaleucine resistance transporter AzlC
METGRKNEMDKNIIKTAFIKSIPILCSYLFVSMAYGIMMEEAGFGWYYSLFASLTVYTGAFQFVLITFLSSGASYLTIAVTALLMNSRQTFYSLTFVEDFKHMGKRLPYMIHTMTDETYAVNCSMLPIQEDALGRSGAPAVDTETGSQRYGIMFLVALFSRCYWMTGAVIGGVLGQLIPFELEGIDFCMTALFVIIFIDQWEKGERHFPALLGIGIAVLCLLLFGADRFMLPALLLVSGILLVKNERKEAAV